MNDYFRITVCCMLIASCALRNTCCDAAEPIIIRLRPVAEINHREVQLADVAQFSFGRERQQQDRQLSTADLMAIPDGNRLALIEKSMIDVRLRLLGMKRDEYLLLGPEQIIVSLVNPEQNGARDPRFSLIVNATGVPPMHTSAEPTEISDLLVEQAIQSALARQFGLPTEDVKSQLLRPFVDDRLSAETLAEPPRIEVITPADFPYGRTNLMVRVWDGDRLISSRTAFLDVRRRQHVLVSRRTIGQTTSVTLDSVTPELRFVDGRRDELQPGDVAGLSAKRTIRVGEILGFDDFRDQSQQPSSAQMIRTRDSVRIVGYRKGLKFVVPAAEALQAGRVGQLIRVRNLHSNKIVVGRVVGAGEVEVSLQ